MARWVMVSYFEILMVIRKTESSWNKKWCKCKNNDKVRNLPSIAPQYELESHTQAQKPPKQFINMKLKVKQEFLNIGLSTPMEKGMKNAIMQKNAYRILAVISRPSNLPSLQFKPAPRGKVWDFTRPTF